MEELEPIAYCSTFRIGNRAIWAKQCKNDSVTEVPCEITGITFRVFEGNLKTSYIIKVFGNPKNLYAYSFIENVDSEYILPCVKKEEEKEEISIEEAFVNLFRAYYDHDKVSSEILSKYVLDCIGSFWSTFEDLNSRIGK